MVSIVVSAVAAIVVAAIAALTAQRRQHAQLAAERERLDLTLQAEQARQSRALIHDRELHDLGGLRDLLDDAAHRIDTLAGAVHHASWVMASAVFDAGAGGRPPHAEYQEVSSAPWIEAYASLHAVRDATQEVAALATRLRIRFAAGEPLVTVYGEIRRLGTTSPSPIDFAEEGLTLMAAGGRLKDHHERIEALRADWDRRAVELAQFAAPAGA